MGHELAADVVDDDAGLRHLALRELREIRMEGNGGEGRHLPGVEYGAVLDAELHVLVDAGHASDRNGITGVVDKPGVLQLQRKIGLHRRGHRSFRLFPCCCSRGHGSDPTRSVIETATNRPSCERAASSPVPIV